MLGIRGFYTHCLIYTILTHASTNSNQNISKTIDRKRLIVATFDKNPFSTSNDRIFDLTKKLRLFGKIKIDVRGTLYLQEQKLNQISIFKLQN